MTLLLFLFFTTSLETLNLSLRDALTVAEKNSPYKAEARWNRVTAAQRVLEPIERILPSPYFNLSYSKHRMSQEGRLYRGEIGINQPLFDVGLISGLIGANFASQYHKLRALFNAAQLKYLTTTAYFHLLKSQELHKVRKEEVVKKEENHRRVAEEYRLKKASRLELLRSENELLLARMQEMDAEKGLLLAQENLKAIIGLEGDLALRATEELKAPESSPYKDLDFSQFWEELRKANPELQAQKKQKALSSIYLWSGIFGFLPSLSLSLSSSYSSSSSFPKSLSEWRDKDAINLSLGLTLPFVDITGYSLSLSLRRQEQKRAEMQLREIYLNLYKNAKDAFFTLRGSFSRYESARKNLELAKELLTLAEEQRKLGTISYLDFLDIQTRYNEAHSSYIASLADINTSIAQVEYLLGR